MKKMKKVLIEGWEEKKMGIMEEILREKFRQNPEIETKLKNTGNNPQFLKGWVLILSGALIRMIKVKTHRVNF